MIQPLSQSKKMDIHYVPDTMLSTMALNKSTVLESLSVNSHLLEVLHTRQRTRLGCKMNKTQDVLMGILVSEAS